MFKDAIFGRDSLEACEDLLDWSPDLAAEVGLTLAGVQGVEEDPVTEEEPGRIHHEWRRRPEPAAPAAEHRLFEALMERWGHGGDELVYYGSVDATPLFVRLVGRFGERFGERLLGLTVETRGGERLVLRESLRRACDWILGRIHSSPAGLLTYRRANPRGLLHQCWKDSPTGYLHPDGRALDTDGPVAVLPVQGLAYDALSHASRMLRDDRAYARRLAAAARELAATVHERFWLESERLYAPALEVGPGSSRPDCLESSDAGAFLDSRCLEALPERKRGRRIEAIARSLFGDGLLSDVGIRCRTVAAAGLIPYADYHGAWMSWPKETYDAAKGLRSWGLPALARDLEVRIVDAANAAGDAYEFFAVSPEGEVLYRPYPPRPDAARVETTNLPEPGQAWSASALLAAKRRLRAERSTRRRPTPLEIALAGQVGLRAEVTVPPPEPAPAPFRLTLA